MKRRMNLSLPKDVEEALHHLAERDEMPAATKALHLITYALEISEDIVFNKLAKERDVKGAKFISHADAWR